MVEARLTMNTNDNALLFGVVGERGSKRVFLVIWGLGDRRFTRTFFGGCCIVIVLREESVTRITFLTQMCWSF